jgi:hypothetical protein
MFRAPKKWSAATFSDRRDNLLDLVQARFAGSVFAYVVTLPYCNDLWGKGVPFGANAAPTGGYLCEVVGAP